MADLAVTEAAAGGELEVVMFPWLAFGHMLPFLELSKWLAVRGHNVAFVSTPRNLARLPPVPPQLSPRLQFVPLPLPPVDGLPEGAECTADVPPGKDDLLKKAFDGLAVPFASYLAAGKRPDWIIHDFSHHWLPPIADEHKVPCALFQIVLAGTNAFIGSRWAHAEHPRTTLEDFMFMVPPKWFPLPSTMSYRRHEAGWLVDSFRPKASGVSNMERFWQVNELCRIAIYRSCDEVEPGMLALLTDLFRKPSIPAGLLQPPPDLSGDDGSRPEVLQWLDEQPPKSVVYVALGSEAPLTLTNLHELALGLELAGVRFMWALRKPSGMVESGSSADDDYGVLPDGFRDRMRGRGRVQTGWVPQVKVLGHGAVAAFLTHCGWGSTIESFAFGHPLVMLPFIIDQPFVARTMAEQGIGVEVARDESDGSFDRHAVAAAVSRVMVEDEGKVFASNAKKLQEVLTDQGQQERYIDDLVDHLRRYKDA